MSERREIPNSSDPALDQLLATARWAEPSAQVHERLTATIRSEGRRSRTIALLRNAGTIAASIALVAASLWLIRHRDQGVHEIGMDSNSPVVVVELPGRAPTRYEQWFIAHVPDQAVASDRQEPLPTAVGPNAEIALLLNAEDLSSVVSLVQRQNDPQTRQTLIVALLGREDGIEPFIQLVRDRSQRDSALAALKSMPDPPIDRLLAELRRPLIEDRQAAAKALGSLCHGQILPSLQNMIETGDHRREALAVLGQCADAKALEYVEFLSQRRSLASELQVVREEMKEMF